MGLARWVGLAAGGGVVYPVCRRQADFTFCGGESIALDDDWSLDVLHVPGHCRGCLALYNQRQKRVSMQGLGGGPALLSNS